MSESTTVATGLTSQYIAQVASDLESNTKEQERIGAEIEALQEQLGALQHDHSVLVNMQQALGVIREPDEPSTTAESTTVPSFPQRTEAAPSSKRRSRKTTVPQETAAKKPATPKAGTPKARPTLVELIRRHLTEQGEPRSAAEISTALGQAHPERGIKTKVVRVTLEGLVAKSQAQRTKQGASVYYTAPDATEPTESMAPPADAQA
ncbi:hypothetical protein OH768_53960 [Streptomyces sp. NBC_01622]|uniref:hypothetical protein n=1 Tax=Streptomyces sp. NBC_01622 TaxID=2975903 RepID=UPI0038675B73|nr:hypothetical protein OH768_53960 [Streptomyces sp. NBC_01622]